MVWWSFPAPFHLSDLCSHLGLSLIPAWRYGLPIYQSSCPIFLVFCNIICINEYLWKTSYGFSSKSYVCGTIPEMRTLPLRIFRKVCWGEASEHTRNNKTIGPCKYLAPAVYMQGPKMTFKDKSLNWLVRYIGGEAWVLVSEDLCLCFHVKRTWGFSQVFFWTYLHIYKMSLTPTSKSHLWVRKIKWT